MYTISSSLNLCVLPFFLGCKVSKYSIKKNSLAGYGCEKDERSFGNKKVLIIIPGTLSTEKGI